MQVDSARKSSRASAEGSRLAVRVGEELTSSGRRLNLDAWLLMVQEDDLVHAGWLKSLAGELLNPRVRNRRLTSR